ncbi:MAG TPA: hypothetical protein VH540_10560 [Ktedonobacterales bacterium]
MFDLGALTILTLFNVLALTQVISTTLVPGRLHSLLRQRNAVLCLGISLSAFALGLLVHQPGISVATLTAAACINLMILLGPLTQQPQSSQTLTQLHAVNGLARLYFSGESGERPAVPPVQRAPSQPVLVLPAPAIRGARPIAQAPAMRTTSRPLSKEEIAKAPSRPRAQTSGRLAPVQTEPRPLPVARLASRRAYTVPHRPNRITTSLGAIQLTPESATALSTFEQSATRKGQFAALATRVRLVVPVEHNESVLPLILTEPDPAWQTTFGRIAALARSA